MDISLIVALTSNGVIGRSNTIPWFLPNDMLWFKFHTLNKPVVMGRKTFESIHYKPLRKRLNIVLSRYSVVQTSYVSNTFYVKTPDEVLWVIKKMYSTCSEVMVIGGAEVYSVFFPQIRRLYLTYIDVSIYGDTFFPYYRNDEWRLVFSKWYNYRKNCCIDYNYVFKIFERC